MEFKYDVSIIVPVYNVEKYLRDCVDSLVNQTIDKSKMEILLINDGSTDSSLEICREYESQYPNLVKVFSKENEGLSATRNFGIKHAQGKYLMYIDSDDYFSLETVKNVTEFFDEVYDEVDLVTYFEQPYGNGNLLAPHFRFKNYLKRTGVYDLSSFPYILQMRINVCVKNLGDKNHLFDTTPNFRQEDQEYNNRVLMDKMKIGYCSTGCYYYNKTNESSIVATTFNPIVLFEHSTEYFEKLASYFDDEIPPYFQAIIFHDMRWKFSSDILFPFHYGEKEFEIAVNRIKKLLSRIDNDIIVNYPNISEQMRCFWLSFKDNSNVIPYVIGRKIELLADGKIVYKRSNAVFNIVRFQSLDNGNIRCRAYLESPIFKFIDEEPDIFVCEDESNIKKLDVYLSKYGYLNKSDFTLNYYAFEYEFDPKNIKSFRFYLNIDGFDIVTKYKFKPMAAFDIGRKLSRIVVGNALLDLRSNIFHCSFVTNEQRDEFEKQQAFGYSPNTDVYDLKVNAIDYRKTHRVWLYSDLYTVEKDNGYYQFIHDFNKNDGVERYYVYTRPYEEIEYLFADEQKKYLVEFASEQHKLLYLASEIILSGFFGRTPISPFLTETEEKLYYDIEHFKVIYLQHGVLHASLYVQNSAENARADKIVISSQFELDNYSNKYHYNTQDLIPSSMARYDHIDRSAKPCGKILFAPSWRNYLAKNVTASKWATNLDEIKKSEYFKNICAFLENEKLAEALEKHNITLELKLHPIIAEEAKSLFSFGSDKIVLAERNVEITDYDMFVTDFSSFVFDYACLGRPIMYFVPDMLPFKAGLGHYRNLDLPFEKAFGPLATEPEAAVDYLCTTMENGFIPESIYKERMDKFYFSLDNCCDRLYNYICSEMLTNGKK